MSFLMALRLPLIVSLLLPACAELQISAPTPQTALQGSDVLLNCTFSVDSHHVDPKYLVVLWYFKEKIIVIYDSKQTSLSQRISFDERAALAGDASIIVSDVNIEDGGIYRCVVIYTPDKNEKEINLNVLVRPTIQIHDKYASENSLVCSATGFYPPPINITWLRDGEVLNNTIVDRPLRSEDGTYRAETELTITAARGHTSDIFNCKVQHESLEEPLQESTRLVYGDKMRSSVTAIVCILVWLVIIGAVVGFLLWKKRLGSKASGRYSVNDIQGPEKLIDGDEVVLICTATDCPEIPRVKWFEKGEVGSFEILEPPDGGHDESKQLQTRNYVIKKKPEGFRDFSTSLRFKFCFRRHNGLTFVCKFIDSKGTKEKSFQCRSVYAKPQLDGPIKASLCISGEVVCCVSLKKFYPKQIKVGWRCEPEDPLTKLIPKEIFQQNSDFTVNVLSEVRIPRDFFTDPKRELRVTWKHESLETPGSCELSARSPDYPWKPVVREIKTPKLFHGLPVTLECEISKYFPDSVTVDWLVKRNDGQEDVCDEESISVTKSQNEDFTSSCTSGLTVTPRLAVHQGVEYICRVWHPSLETPTERRTGKLRIVAKPCMKEPIKATLEESSRISFSLNLQNVYPRDINITWNNDIKASKPLLESTGNPMESEDLTFNVTSSCSIPGTIFETPQDQVTVKWEHESLDAPESASLCVRDFPWRPQMEDIQIPKVEADKKTALRCGISGYFPDKLSVRWYKRQTDSEMELPRDKYEVSAKSAKQSDKTYRCESSMKFTPHLGQDQGVEFICRVSHPTLEQPIEKTTGPLSIAYGGKPNVSDIKLRNGLLTLEVNNFYPRDIQISWRVKPESADKYEVLGTPAGEVTENKDGTFRVTSTCEHPSNEKGRPCVVVAVVTHKSLKTPEEKKFQLK